MPEILWKAYIDFEISLGETSKARNLHERLLERSHHIKVWMSYAKFEMSHPEEEGVTPVSLARKVYERANNALRAEGEKEERVLLLEAWRELEKKHGDEENLQRVESKLPRRVKRRQKIIGQDGVICILF